MRVVVFIENVSLNGLDKLGLQDPKVKSQQEEDLYLVKMIGLVVQQELELQKVLDQSE